MYTRQTAALPILLCLGLALASPTAAQNGKTRKVTPAAAKAAQASKPNRAEAAGKRKTAAAPPFAIVDMRKAASHTKAFKSGLATRAKMKDSYQKEIEAMTARIKSLKLEIEIMQVSPERMQKQLDCETLISRHGFATKMYNSDLERERVVNDDKIYVELQTAVAELANSRGILMVFRRRPHLTVREMLQKNFVRSETEGISHQIRANQQRSVIYHVADLDLTDDLIKYLKR